MKARTVVAALVLLGLGAAAWAAFAPFDPERRTLTFVIPPGTATRMKSGEPPTVLPEVVRLTVGVRDVLVLTNDDTAVHQIGPIVLGSRQTYRIPFRQPGSFSYACSLHAAGRLAVVVAAEPAPGLERLLFRLARLREGRSPDAAPLGR